jgi:hypothetical protein
MVEESGEPGENHPPGDRSVFFFLSRYYIPPISVEILLKKAL